MPHETSRRRLYWPLLAVAATGLAVRFAAIDHIHGINGDEAYSAFQAWQFWNGEAITFRTGTGLPVNPVFFPVSVLGQALGGVNWTAMRLPCLFFGCLAVLLWVPMLQRRIGTRASVVACALAATTPILIVYSRFSWDTSASPFVSLLCLYAALQRKPLLSALLVALAVWVHPANVFLAPIVAAPFLVALWPRVKSRRGGRAFLLSASAVLLALIVFFPLLATLPIWSDTLQQHVFSPAKIEAYRERLRHPERMLEFVQLYGDLISGVTIYAYITGLVSDVSRAAHTALFWLVMLCTWPFGIRALCRERDGVLLPMVVGMLVALLLAFLLAGSRMLAPHTERYAMFLPIPTCLFTAVFLDRIAGEGARRHQLLCVGVALLGTAQLLGVRHHYFGALQAAHTEAHVAFQTGPTEPKEQALREIGELRDPSRTTVVLADSWWSYWPIRYLSENLSGYRISIAGQAWDYRFPADFILSGASAPVDPEYFGVAFVGSRFDRWLAAHAPGAPIAIHGYAAAPLMRVYRCLHEPCGLSPP
jgi:4-amino-4-deoxy-L-arabinose transferase-like glycosyltransferase